MQKESSTAAERSAANLLNLLFLTPLLVPRLQQDLAAVQNEGLSAFTDKEVAVGFRFQRRITLAPGFRLNLSKRGLGLSVGPRGASLSAGPSGVHGHAGIPGTGLAYRQKLKTRSRSAVNGSSGAGRSSSAALEALLSQGESLPIRLDIDAAGTIHYAHGDGTPMSDDEARVLRRHAGDSLREQLTQHCERLNVDLDRLGRLHEETPHPNITVYVTRDFTEMPPAPPALRQPAWWHWLWPPARRRVACGGGRLCLASGDRYADCTGGEWFWPAGWRCVLPGNERYCMRAMGWGS